MKSLHISLSTAHSECKPSTFMSSSTHSFQVFLFLLLHLTSATSTFLQADTQSSTILLYKDIQTTSICHASPHPPNQGSNCEKRTGRVSNTAGTKGLEGHNGMNKGNSQQISSQVLFIYIFIYLFIENICICNTQLMQTAQAL